MGERVAIASGVRTAIGRFGGGLKDVPAQQLGAVVLREALARAHVSPGEVDEVVLGCVGQFAEDAYIARAAALSAQFPQTTPAYTVNRLCGSGLQALVSAAQSIRSGDSRVAAAGGVEVMSGYPFYARQARWGMRLGHATLEDGVMIALSDPFSGEHMGVTAERLAKRYDIRRDEQDAFALASHARAVRAWEEGRFQTQVIPFEVAGKNRVMVARDEGPRADTSAERLARLPAVFQENGTVTAGNSAGINDGAAAVVLLSEDEVQRRGEQPLGYLVAATVCGVDPRIMGIGPVPATEKLLERIGWTWDDVDLIELNEAFAAQSLAVLTQWPEAVRGKVNVNGGAIALGHPIGASGAILVVKVLHELARIGGRRGIVTLCIGGGQGIAAAFERE